MIQTLNLKSFVLIENATIEFKPGFSIFTGETGAGKTLLVQAIQLLCGHKVSDEIIRNGCDKAVVEALIDIQNVPLIKRHLLHSGIDIDCQDPLIIKREIHKGAKNRVFINGQLSTLSLLKKIGPLFVELVNQNSSYMFRKPEMQRELLDLYGCLWAQSQEIQKGYDTIEKQKNTLIELKEKLKRTRIEPAKAELSDWENLNYAAGEEQELFEKYKKMNQLKEQQQNIGEIKEIIDQSSLLTYLNRIKKLFLDPDFQKHVDGAIAHIHEASYIIDSAGNNLSHSDECYQTVEARLASIHTLQKKYNIQPLEIPNHISFLKKQINDFANLNIKIEEIEKGISQDTVLLLKKAHLLSNQRKKCVENLEKELKVVLKKLNFSQPEPKIFIKPKQLGPQGIDSIHFTLSANCGEKVSEISNHLSGGEVSRYLLALKLITNKKQKLPTLVFDEIDANIGGITAKCVGLALKELGNDTQVVAITHFPQVAKCADNHLRIYKSQENNRTVTSIMYLDKTQAQEELLRMIGDDCSNAENMLLLS